MLASARIDLMAAVWLPEGHGAYWARYGEGAQEIARLYDGARFFWAVPSYVPPDEVVSIEDLAKPSVAARMTKLIHGIGPGAAITTLSRKAIEDYGLDGRRRLPGLSQRRACRATQGHPRPLARRPRCLPDRLQLYLRACVDRCGRRRSQHRVQHHRHGKEYLSCGDTAFTAQAAGQL